MNHFGEVFFRPFYFEIIGQKTDTKKQLNVCIQFWNKKEKNTSTESNCDKKYDTKKAFLNCGQYEIVGANIGNGLHGQ